MGSKSANKRVILNAERRERTVALGCSFSLGEVFSAAHQSRPVLFPVCIIVSDLCRDLRGLTMSY